jgi:hypothetical protein
MKDKTDRSRQKESMEDKYWEIVRRGSHSMELPEEESLEQPHLYKFVDSVTTYGAYEKPI